MSNRKERIRRKKKEPVESHTEIGGQAHLAQLVYYLGQSLDDIPPTANLSNEDIGLIRAFQKELSEATKLKKAKRVIEAWKRAKKIVSGRELQNRRAFLSQSELAEQFRTQKEVFEEKIKEHFPKAKLVNYNGDQILSTRRGGLGWAIGRSLLVAINPREEERTELHYKKNGKNGEVAEEKTKIVRKIDASLFDDDLGISPKGLIFWNPSLGADEVMIPWDEVGTLLFSADTTAYLDIFNTRIKPIFTRRLAPWTPVGILRVKDRRSGDTFVEVLMLNPGKFRAALEKMRKDMKRVAIPTQIIEAMAPLRLVDFVGDGPTDPKSVGRLRQTTLFRQKGRLPKDSDPVTLPDGEVTTRSDIMLQRKLKRQKYKERQAVMQERKKQREASKPRNRFGEKVKDGLTSFLELGDRVVEENWPRRKN